MTRDSERTGRRESREASDAGAAVRTDGGVPGGGSDSVDPPVARGAYLGVLAWIGGFFTNYVLTAAAIDGLNYGSLKDYEFVGWVFYGAHGVEITSQGSSANMLDVIYAGGQDPSLPKLVFYAAPVVVLVLVGRRLAREAVGDRDVAPAESAKAAATVGVGYAALAVVGALTLFSVSGPTATSEPELVTSLLYFGLFGTVAAGIGGYVTAQ
jgi:hypothetical protein